MNHHEPPDFTTLPDAFLQDLNKELNEQNRLLEQFWKKLSTISQHDFPFKPSKILKNLKILKKIAESPKNIIRIIFPTLDVPQFFHSKTVLNELFTCLDPDLSANVDIEKYFENNDLE